MAKIAYTKLGLLKDKLNEITMIEHNEQSIEVKQYLPINDKLALISNVINKAADENNFANPIKLDVFKVVEVIYAYTNINFTEKQKEDEVKLYDLFISSGLWEKIMKAIPEDEYTNICRGIYACAEAVYEYRNSVLGILESISADYSNLNLEAEEIREKVGNPEVLGLLKEVLTKLG